MTNEKTIIIYVTYHSISIGQSASFKTCDQISTLFGTTNNKCKIVKKYNHTQKPKFVKAD